VGRAGSEKNFEGTEDAMLIISIVQLSADSKAVIPWAVTHHIARWLT
jgi:hypothetical protein